MSFACLSLGYDSIENVNLWEHMMWKNGKQCAAVPNAMCLSVCMHLFQFPSPPSIHLSILHSFCTFVYPLSYP